MITTSASLSTAPKQVRIDRLIAALSKIPSTFTLTPTSHKHPVRTGWNKENLSRAELAKLLKHGVWIEQDDRKFKQEYDGLALIIPSGYVVVDIDGSTAHRFFSEISKQKQPDKTVAWSSSKPHNGSLLYRLPDALTARMNALQGQPSKIRLTECPTWKTQGSDAIELLLAGSSATIPPSAHPETSGYEFKLD